MTQEIVTTQVTQDFLLKVTENFEENEVSHQKSMSA